jgi:hypothetical protein
MRNFPRRPASGGIHKLFVFLAISFAMWGCPAKPPVYILSELETSRIACYDGLKWRKQVLSPSTILRLDALFIEEGFSLEVGGRVWRYRPPIIFGPHSIGAEFHSRREEPILLIHASGSILSGRRRGTPFAKWILNLLAFRFTLSSDAEQRV